LCQPRQQIAAETVARYANAAAAIAVQGFGAVAPLPRPEQVKDLL
jgi:2-dehydro-3-deoxygluconokinase